MVRFEKLTVSKVLRDLKQALQIGFTNSFQQLALGSGLTQWIDSRYVEMGKDRRSSGTYTLRYMWKGGGLFGGRTLHLVGISR